jgi:DNA-binding Lrp family transcriptional regulator
LELALSTGNTIVDQISEMNFTGNIIPAEWFKTLRGPNGKPMLLAIDILSDILYWYRPTEIRDERTGALVGYKKKFKKDFLQRSYRQIEDQFGVSKKQARLALDFLCRKGVIKKHLVDETTKDGMKLHNNMYLELVPEKLKEITYIHRSSEGVSLKEPPCVFDDNTVVSVRTEGNYLQVTTSTENTTEITTKEFNNPINLKTDGSFYVHGPSECRGKPVKQIDEIDEIAAYREVIKENIDYENLMASQSSEAEKQRIDEIYEIICDVVCSKKGTIRVGGEDKPLEVVKSVFLKLTSEHIEYVTECLDKTYTDIGNIRSYLITALYRSIQTVENFTIQKVNHGMHEYATRNRELGGVNGEDD